ncbi:hypothetical protein L6R53_25165 [Myxococcota bacterium]|nr:hypothetical protein [Myxococcota bacterium]
MTAPAPSPARTWPAVLAGGAAALVYLSTLAHTQGPDALAYAELARARDLHPQHLLQHLLGGVALAPAQALAPGLHPALVLAAGNALAGGLGVGLCWLLAARAGAGPLLATAAAALFATAHGWWTVSTTAEVHAAPVAVQALAALWVGRRPAAAGLAHGAAALLHKTMILGLPGLLLAAGARAGLLLLGAALVVGLPYAALIGRDLARGDPLEGTATHWLLGELAQPPPAARPGPGRAVAASRGLGGAWVHFSPPRCGFDQGRPDFPNHHPMQRRQLWRGVQVGGALALAMGLLGAVALARRDRPLLWALAGWIALAVPAALWFEPDNPEYYLGPLLALLVLAAGGAQRLARATPAPAPVAALLALGGLLAAGAVGAHHLASDIGPAMHPRETVRRCGAPVPAR